MAMAVWSPCAPAQGWSPEPYRGHRLVRIHTETPSQLARALTIAPDAWACRPAVGEGLYRVEPEAMAALEASGLKFEVVSEDVQELVDVERAQRVEAAARRGAGFFDTYRTFAEVRAGLDALVALRPDMASKVNLGSSIELRPIEAIRIHAPGAMAGARPTVLITGGQHAREWISVMSAMYLADRLIRGHEENSEFAAILERVEIIVVPVVNPDGYEYSWTTSRLWRKNRRPGGTFNPGVDLNRNWSEGWGDNNGSSAAPGSETYRGPSPFSEPETQRVRDFVLATPSVRAHIDVHSYAQVVLGVWGYTTSPATRAPTMLPMGWRLADMLSSLGAQHHFGTGGSFIGVASGIMPDWMFGQRGVFSWTIELRDTGEFGFLLPADQIIPTSEELLAGVLALAQWVADPVDFRFPSGVPAYATPGVPTTVRIDAGSLGATPVSTGAKLFHRVGGFGPFTETALTTLSSLSFQGELPARSCGQNMQWYVQLNLSGGGVATSPAGAPAQTHRTLVRSEAVGFEDDFEVDRGWTVGGSPGGFPTGDNATSGVWVRVDPVGTGSQPENDVTAPPGIRCFVTGQGTTNGAEGDADVDGGKTTLTSPTINTLQSAGDAYVSYHRWFSNHRGDNPNSDAFFIEISPDDGATWALLERVVVPGQGWVFRRWRVADFVPRTAQTRVRFVARDDNPGSLVEAAVDEFRLTFIACAGQVVGDVTGDGLVNSQDLAQLLGLWGPCPAPCAADLNGDGFVSSPDLALLLGSWTP